MHFDEHGLAIVEGFEEAWKGYAQVVGEEAAWDDGGFVFEDEPTEGAGIKVLKRDAAEGGQGVEGAEFTIYPEEAFADAYARWRAANPDAAEKEFFSAINPGGETSDGYA